MTTKFQQNNLPIQILAPWANIVLKSKIPDDIFQDLLKIANGIVMEIILSDR